MWRSILNWPIQFLVWFLRKRGYAVYSPYAQSRMVIMPKDAFVRAALKPGRYESYEVRERRRPHWVMKHVLIDHMVKFGLTPEEVEGILTQSHALMKITVSTSSDVQASYTQYALGWWVPKH